MHLLLLAALSAAAHATNDALFFRSDGSFKLSIFSDMHFGMCKSPIRYQFHPTDDLAASSTGPAADASTVRVIGDVLDWENPDLVVLNGDLINGDTSYAHNASLYLDQIVQPMVDRNLTWASTYGNHDHSYPLNGSAIYQRERRFSGSRTISMVNGSLAGPTNYYLPVHGCADCDPELILWFFDSRGGSYNENDPQPNWVDESVVNWFTETNDALVSKYNRTIPSLAFAHIPVGATCVLRERGVDRHRQPGIDEDVECAQQSQNWCPDGTQSDNCDHGGQDEPFMKALVATKGLMGLFYGHDHGNSWCYKWDEQLPGMDVTGSGINLCYGQHTGYGGYGDWIRGSRQLIVSRDALNDGVVDTRIRLESGNIVGEVALNSTFNEDKYPATPNQKTYLGKNSNGNVNVFMSSRSSAAKMEPYSWSAAMVYLAALAVIFAAVL